MQRCIVWQSKETEIIDLTILSNHESIEYNSDYSNGPSEIDLNMVDCLCIYWEGPEKQLINELSAIRSGTYEGPICLWTSKSPTSDYEVYELHALFEGLPDPEMLGEVVSEILADEGFGGIEEDDFVDEMLDQSTDPKMRQVLQELFPAGALDGIMGQKDHWLVQKTFDDVFGKEYNKNITLDDSLSDPSGHLNLNQEINVEEMALEGIEETPQDINIDNFVSDQEKLQAAPPPPEEIEIEFSSAPSIEFNKEELLGEAPIEESEPGDLTSEGNTTFITKEDLENQLSHPDDELSEEIIPPSIDEDSPEISFEVETNRDFNEEISSGMDQHAFDDLNVEVSRSAKSNTGETVNEVLNFDEPSSTGETKNSFDIDGDMMTPLELDSDLGEASPPVQEAPIMSESDSLPEIKLADMDSDIQDDIPVTQVKSPELTETYAISSKDVFSEPANDPRPPEDLQVSKKSIQADVAGLLKSNSEYLAHHDNELVKYSAMIRNLREDREELITQIRKLEEENKSLHNDLISVTSERDELKIETSLQEKRHQDEMNDVIYRMNLAMDKKRMIEEKMKMTEKGNVSLKQQSRMDLRRIREREKELENQLDLLRADTEIQITNRENKILELKRYIDALEFDMENFQEKERRLLEEKLSLEHKLENMMKSIKNLMQGAGMGVSEELPSRGDLIKKVKL